MPTIVTAIVMSRVISIAVITTVSIIRIVGIIRSIIIGIAVEPIAVCGIWIIATIWIAKSNTEPESAPS
jgi:hypothetical protein